MVVTTPPAPITISAVERETGLGKDTLRMWERRYGFPTPLRDEMGERRYPHEQVTKLRLISRLTLQGVRPAKLVHRSTEELLLQLKSSSDASYGQADESPALATIFDAIRSHDADALRHELKLALLGAGLRHFLTEFIEPLNLAVGNAWARGELAISNEHLYSEQIQVMLRNAIETVPVSTAGPRILLTTLPAEQHQLGLLMAHAYLALEGARCISLGAQTPIRELQSAAVAHRVNVIGLSFASLRKGHEAEESLTALRSGLGFDIQIWAGGKVWERSRAAVQGVTTISSLTDIPRTVAAWRASHL